MIDKKTVRRCLYYHSITGQFVWLIPSKYHREKTGHLAGSCVNGYLTICINGRAYGAHRLVWLYVYGKWPRDQLDHINRNGLDNRIVNLRECTPAENVLNHSKSLNGSGLPVGVRLLPSGRYWARVAYHGRTFHLGTFETPGKASTAYLCKRKELFGEFSPC